MALDLKLSLRDLLSWYYLPCRVKGNGELKRLGNLTVFRDNVIIFEPLKLSNEGKICVRPPKRIRVLATDLYASECAEEIEKGIKESNDFGDVGNAVDDLSVEQCTDARPGLCSSSLNVIDKQYVMELLGYCSREEGIELGKICHSLAVKNGFCNDKIVSTSLVNMYAKCGELETAVMLFDRMVHIDIASCNCLISGYVSNGMFSEAIGFFVRMGITDIRPNHYTYSIMISACGRFFAGREGKQFHCHVVKMQYVSSTAVNNSLLTMYSKCGMMEEAESLFRDLPGKNIVSWTAIITGLYQQKAFEKALVHFHLMRENRIEPNEYTYTMALSCCGGMKQCDTGRAIHAQVINNGMASGTFVGTAIVDMYAELGQMDDAEKQLLTMGSTVSSVSWNALITGFVHNEKNEAALEAFQKMVEKDVTCDEYTYSIAVIACSSFPSLAMCKQIHSAIIKACYGTNLHVASSLIEAYAKCGDLEDAEKVFYKISTPDVVSFSSMIKAYSQYGFSRKAILLFRTMVAEGKRPTSSTFLAVLSACSHCGLVQEGQEVFKSMVRDYGISPEETHYSCMVDLLSRSGHLENALDFIRKLPVQPTAAIWRPLLAGCWYHGNIQLAEIVAKYILELDPSDAAVYVTLSNMYARVGRLTDASKQRELMDLKDAHKEPGCSWIEVNNRIYKFFSGNNRHPDMPKVYEKLIQFMREMKYSEHNVNTTSVVHQEFGQIGEEKSLYHSEKLAVCFGLLNLPPGTPVRVFKNIRVCLDCHTMMKHISRITKQEIILRDNYRFHHFNQGCCSCGDFW